ncbi:MAG: hypothetical protein LBU94_05150 [Clostridiales bacterium]|jgi:hypothetical protein|nr:hypothetical protein [Clostridiales bacterium]
MKAFIKDNKIRILNMSFVLICVCYILSYFGGTGESHAFMTFSSIMLFVSAIMAAVI